MTTILTFKKKYYMLTFLLLVQQFNSCLSLLTEFKCLLYPINNCSHIITPAHMMILYRNNSTSSKKAKLQISCRKYKYRILRIAPVNSSAIIQLFIF